MARRGPVVSFEGAREFARQLDRMGDELAEEFRQGLAEIAEDAAEGARGAAATRGTGQQRRAAWGIEGRSTALSAKLTISTKGDLPFALGAFFGAKAYPQFPRWVGNTWEAGVKGEGPYHVNDALAEEADRAEERFGDLVEDLAVRSRAFPLRH